MLRRLYLDGCFTHHDKTFMFENGLTGIIGPNESGKSLIVEMIRFSLFGSRALRGKAEDYKKLHVELDFEVKDVVYRVIRKGPKVTLQGGDQEVSGTRPVDDAIRTILGYDLNVFDVANACNQGNIEALSEMTPTARKAMVDQTVGLTALDDLIKFAGQEGNTLKREAEAVSSGLVKPAKPVKPKGYKKSETILLADKEAELTEYNQLVGFVSRVPREPEEPMPIPTEYTSVELQAYQDSRVNLERSIQNLEAKLAGIEPEGMDEAKIATWHQHHDLHDLWKQKERLLAQGHICCPECNHEWPVADLDGLEDVVEVEAPSVSRRELAQHEARVGNDEQRAVVQQNINALTQELEKMVDRKEDLALVRAHEAAMGIYENQMKSWLAYNEDLIEKKARMEELDGIDEVVEKMRVQRAEAQQYERDLERYDRDILAYQERSAEAERLSARSAEFLKAREIIQALKVSVKTHLLPSLNKVASMLLSQMTGGERYQVEVDEDFDIQIDGQRINTLSGSGKAVANLAIRIALGQILTNRMFSVFMADEVDAAMDDERATYTSDALRRLTDQVQQVILVTHKRPETDQSFELKK